MSSTTNQTMFGRLPVLARSASSFFCAACSWAGNDSAGSMLSLVRTALLMVEACAKDGVIAAGETVVASIALPVSRN